MSERPSLCEARHQGCGAEFVTHTCMRYGNGSIPFRGSCEACQKPRQADLCRGLMFLLDALEETGMTDDEMIDAPGMFYVRLLAAKSSLERALA